jgi:hypothetical protein
LKIRDDRVDDPGSGRLLNALLVTIYTGWQQAQDSDQTESSDSHGKGNFNQ